MEAKATKAKARAKAAPGKPRTETKAPRSPKKAPAKRKVKTDPTARITPGLNSRVPEIRETAGAIAGLEYEDAIPEASDTAKALLEETKKDLAASLSGLQSSPPVGIPTDGPSIESSPILGRRDHLPTHRVLLSEEGARNYRAIINSRLGRHKIALAIPAVARMPEAVEAIRYHEEGQAIVRRSPIASYRVHDLRLEFTGKRKTMIKFILLALGFNPNRPRNPRFIASVQPLLPGEAIG